MRPLLLLAVFFVLVVAPSAGAWTWPASGPVLQPYDFDPAHPYAAGQHRGIDIAGDAAATVLAPATGTVTFAGTVPSSGKSITIATSAGDAVTLTHLGSLLVAAGAAVTEGDGVGTIGPSGDPEVAQPYVHLGVRIAAEAQGYLDPLSVLPGRAAAPTSPAPAAADPGAGRTADAPGTGAAPPATAAPSTTSPVATSPAPASQDASAAASEPATAQPAAVSAPAASAAAPPTARRSAVKAQSSSFFVVRRRPGSAGTPGSAIGRAPGREPRSMRALVRGTAEVRLTRGSTLGSRQRAARGSMTRASTARSSMARAQRSPRGNREPAPAAAGLLSAAGARPRTKSRARDADVHPRTIRAVARPARAATSPGVESIAPLDRPAREPAHSGGASALRQRPSPATDELLRLGGFSRAAVLAMVVAVLTLGVGAVLAAVRFQRADGAIRMIERDGSSPEDPGSSRLAVCGGPSAPGACGGLWRPVGRIRSLPPAQGQRRSHGQRDGRARHAGDGRRRSRGEALR